MVRGQRLDDVDTYIYTIPADGSCAALGNQNFAGGHVIIGIINSL